MAQFSDYRSRASQVCQLVHDIIEVGLKETQNCGAGAGSNMDFLCRTQHLHHASMILAQPGIKYGVNGMTRWTHPCQQIQCPHILWHIMIPVNSQTQDQLWRLFERILKKKARGVTTQKQVRNGKNV